MPWAIVLMGMVFNTINAYMIGGWLFYVAGSQSLIQIPRSHLPSSSSALLFSLRDGYKHAFRPCDSASKKTRDTRHYIPRKGFYKYVTAANYLGEFTEWIGFAILTWSAPGQCSPSGHSPTLLRERVLSTPAIQKNSVLKFTSLRRRYIIPFLY